MNISMVGKGAEPPKTHPYFLIFGGLNPCFAAESAHVWFVLTICSVIV